MSVADTAAAFHREMLEICCRRMNVSPLLGYTVGTFWLEICELGGLETAKQIIRNDEVGMGFVALCQFKRVDLAVESLIQDNPRWHALFSEEELAVCASRLRRYRQYNVVQHLPSRSPDAKIA